jgi:hypothetical protein
MFQALDAINRDFGLTGDRPRKIPNNSPRAFGVRNERRPQTRLDHPRLTRQGGTHSHCSQTDR